MKTHNEPQAERLLRAPEVMQMTGLPHSSLYAHVAKGRFPRPIKPTPRTALWKLSEVLTWVEAKTAERDGKVA